MLRYVERKNEEILSNLKVEDELLMKKSNIFKSSKMGKIRIIRFFFV